jgi:uncharacterized protein
MILRLLPLLLLASACNGGPAEANTHGPENRQSLTAPALRLPELTGRVVDAANMLPADREQALTRQLEALEREAGPQFVVVTVPSLGGRTIEELGVDLGRRWGIGDRRRHDGVLLIVAPNEREVRIEVGYGLEASLRDERCREIIDRDMLPRFRRGDFEGGIEAGSAAIIARLRASPTLETAT